MFAAIAVAALFLVRRRADLSAAALGAVGAGFGALDLLYVLYRNGDVKDEVKKLSYGVVSVENETGYYVLLLGAAGVLAGAVWFMLIARGGNRAPRGSARATSPATYQAGYYGRQPVAVPPPPQPQQSAPAYPPPLPVPSGGPQQPAAVYPAQVPPPPLR